MLNAVSIYKGGIFIDAYNCNYKDYKILGLRCPECGEEVYLKKGEKKIAHFAHFKKISEVKCSQRFENIYEKNWQSLSLEGKGQRQELFKLHFLKIIKNTFNDFNLSREGISSETIKLIDNICKKFIEIRNKLTTINISSSIFKNWDKEIVLNGLITREAVDYLSLKQNKKLLDLIILYAINTNPEDKDSLNYYENICFKLRELLLKVNWNIEFVKISPIVNNELNLRQNKSNNSYENCHNIAYKYYYEGEFELAIPYFTELIQGLETGNFKITNKDYFNDEYYSLHNHRVTCYESLGNYEEAIDDITKIIDFLLNIFKIYNLDYTSHIDKLLIEAYFKRSDLIINSSKSNLYKLFHHDCSKVIVKCLLKLRKDEKLEEEEREEIKSILSDTFYKKGIYYAHTEKEYELSIQCFFNAILYYPDPPVDSFFQEMHLINLCSIYNFRGEAYSKNKDTFNSIQDYNKSIFLSEKLDDATRRKFWESHIASFYINRLELYYEVGEYEQALDDANYVIENTINNLYIYDNYTKKNIPKSIFEIRADLKEKIWFSQNLKKSLKKQNNRFKNKLNSYRKNQNDIDNIKLDLSKALEQIKDWGEEEDRNIEDDLQRILNKLALPG